MSKRITQGVARPAPVSVLINGRSVEAYEGESVLTALVAAGVLTMSRDSFGRVRTPFCNMGVCFDCMVDVESSDGVTSRVRACLTPVRAGLRVTVAELP
ncbi:(2Fe-2S)-binding protein [Steroidobacter sp.]|uniref:(2Fe-2S)-binding protein n=1 Tax=Steroidobacter sp. TaxID=1978227 RepID=UPI001A500E6C|nr:(2Fe-2S)-binding protein [Steroidobacter sp.]MBL8270499.1 (2Fe-2S)-binding protein [Steroidobacter sp.]